ncbi:MAG: CofH family radical SAM protein [Rikenellaceae bacterium]
MLKNTPHSRLSVEDALRLWEEMPLAQLGAMATELKIAKSGSTVFYNKNIHLEPTNICVFRCKFCSYRRAEGEPGSWNYTMEEMEEICRSHSSKAITEVHIVGGVDPRRGFEFYEELLHRVGAILPNVALKTYTAVELHYIITKAGLTIEEGLRRLQKAGMRAIAGGGAEIFDPAVRNEICPDKCSAEEWLEVHRTAHSFGIPTNATILYGHIETIEQRLRHLEQLRELQDHTGGFSAFIPLKFKTSNNELGEKITATSITEDLRMMALCRLFLDNFDHIKAYWPMLGKATTELALAFGADDIDGTIDDTTKIYSMAGAEDQNPRLDSLECENLIKRAGYIPVERDTFYNAISK